SASSSPHPPFLSFPTRRSSDLSFLDILQKFISYQKEVKKTTLPDGKVRTDTAEKIIFPRYHQLDVVRKLVHHTREHGPGHNYLIDRKSTRLNSSHVSISYAVFC